MLLLHSVSARLSYIDRIERLETSANVDIGYCVVVVVVVVVLGIWR